jgi:hypothetical protein
MVRPRISQFADDMGITRSQAVKLINEGRRRRDGGSQTVEKNMSEMKTPKARSKDAEYNMRFQEERAAHNRRRVEKEMEEETEKRAMGGMCRGGGKAIQGMKYTGCK